MFNVRQSSFIEDAFNIYMRAPKIVADFVYKNYNNNIILLYGTGKHSHDFLREYQGSNIVAIVEESDVDSSYKHFDFGDIRICKEYELRDIVFDYLVFLGDWDNQGIENKALSLCISCEKMLFPYKTKAVKEKLITKTAKHIQDFNLSADKTNLIVFIAFDRKDIITVASPVLSKYFNLIKVYTKPKNISTIYHESNTYFNQIIYLEDLLELIPRLLLKKNEKILATYWVTTPLEMYEAMYVKSLLPKDIKFILSSTDLCLTGLYNASKQELIGCWSMPDDVFEINKAAEEYLITNSDGIISSYMSNFYEDKLSINNKNVFSSFFFTDPKDFTFKNTVIEATIKLCTTGSLIFSDSQNSILKSLYFSEIFDNLLSQGFELDVFSTIDLYSYDKEENYISLLKKYDGKFNWFVRTPSSQMPSKMSGCHFGLVLRNLTDEVLRAYEIEMSSLFQARVITYLAAGIPIIVNREYKLIADFVLEHSIGIVVSQQDLLNLEKIILSYDYNVLKCNVKKFQKFYENQNYDEQLANFLKDSI